MGPKKEDGIWAKYWYQNVHNTTTFNKYKKRDFKLDSKNDKLAESVTSTITNLEMFQ